MPVGGSVGRCGSPLVTRVAMLSEPVLGERVVRVTLMQSPSLARRTSGSCFP